jgi:hypothetical protein
VVRYLQLAHNRRKGASTQAEVLVSLGREDRLDVEGLRRLVGSIGRYLDRTRGLPAASPLPGGEAWGLVAESSWPIGASATTPRRPSGTRWCGTSRWPLPVTTLDPA